MRARRYARRGILAIAALGAALTLAVGTAGAQEEPVQPQAVRCTIWLPPSGADCIQLSAFQPGYSYGAIYNDIGWYASGWARRDQAGWALWGNCLPSDAQIFIRYVRQNGSVMWATGSPYGSCGQHYNVDSNGEYVQVQIRLHRDCSSPCPNSMYAWVGAYSWWF